MFDVTSEELEQDVNFEPHLSSVKESTQTFSWGFACNGGKDYLELISRVKEIVVRDEAQEVISLAYYDGFNVGKTELVFTNPLSLEFRGPVKRADLYLSLSDAYGGKVLRPCTVCEFLCFVIIRKNMMEGCYLKAGMKSVKMPDGSHRVLTVTKKNGKYVLGTCDGNPNAYWAENSEWVFAVV